MFIMRSLDKGHLSDHRELNVLELQFRRESMFSTMSEMPLV
jgi:hypothetical protein